MKSPETKEKDLFRNKRRYHRLKAAGICVKCGQAKAVDGAAKCPECIEKSRMYRERYRKGLTTPPRRTALAEEYTPEEIADIQRDDVTTAAMAAKYAVTYDQILYIKRHKDDPEACRNVRKMVFRTTDTWYPLEPPKGDVRKMCGYCERFTDYALRPNLGIYGRCGIDGKERCRCDFCTHPECYARFDGGRCARINDRVTDGEQLGVWQGNIYER